MHIHCEVTVNVAQAVIGSKIKIRTVSGRMALLAIPPGTQPGSVLRLKGAGIHKEADTGDQYVKINVKLPTKLSEEEKEFLRRIGGRE